MIDEKLIEAINGLYKNQEILNAKLDGILTAVELMSKAEAKILETSTNIFQNSIIIREDLKGLKNQSADVQIMIQNSNGDHDSIVEAIRDTSVKIDELKMQFNEWKIYSEL